MSLASSCSRRLTTAARATRHRWLLLEMEAAALLVLPRRRILSRSRVAMDLVAQVRQQHPEGSPMMLDERKRLERAYCVDPEVL